MNTRRLPQLLAAASKYIMENDRVLFHPYLSAAEKYIAENDIVIGGNIGIDMLLGVPIHIESQPWDLYCSDPWNTGRTLADALAKVPNAHIRAETISLQTNIRNRELTLAIDTRFMFRIYQMDKYRGADLVTVMGPVTVNGYFGNRVKVFPQEMVLIGVYQGLYALNTVKISQWPKFAAIESALVDPPDVSGGASNRIVAACHPALLSMLKDPRIVIIGEFAAAELGVAGRGDPRLQIVTAIPISELTAMTSKVLSSAKDKLRSLKITSIKVTAQRYHLCIPSDFQLVKHTVYMVSDSGQTPLYDTFNSPEYETVPFIKVNSRQCGHPFVLLRFCYIDIWVLKLIGALGSTTADRVEAIRRQVAPIRNLLAKYEQFQLENYIGVNTSDTVAKKKLIKLEQRVPNYYPAVKK